MASNLAVRALIDTIVRDALTIVDDFDNAVITRETLAHRLRNAVEDDVDRFIDDNLVEIEDVDEDDEDYDDYDYDDDDEDDDYYEEHVADDRP